MPDAAEESKASIQTPEENAQMSTELVRYVMTRGKNSRYFGFLLLETHTHARTRAYTHARTRAYTHALSLSPSLFLRPPFRGELSHVKNHSATYRYKTNYYVSKVRVKLIYIYIYIDDDDMYTSIPLSKKRIVEVFFFLFFSFLFFSFFFFFF